MSDFGEVLVASVRYATSKTLGIEPSHVVEDGISQDAGTGFFVAGCVCLWEAVATTLGTLSPPHGARGILDLHRERCSDSTRAARDVARAAAKGRPAIR